MFSKNQTYILSPKMHKHISLYSIDSNLDLILPQKFSDSASDVRCKTHT